MKRRLLAVALALCASRVPAQPTDASSARTDSGPRRPIRATVPCVVERVVDGDTIRCYERGLVRLIGMDTPEPDQRPFGDAAKVALLSMVQVGDTVQLEGDVEPRDRYRRTLAYVWRRGIMLNWAMLRQGWAVVLTYPPNVQYTDDFVTAHAGARVEKRGLWRIEGFQCLPVEHRRRIC